MDTPNAVTHVSLCAGYGGIDLGLKRAIPSLRTIAFSEIEAFACANLVAKMEAGLLDPAPVWSNLKTFPWEKFHGCVDILSGGYPCQPFSAAGKRLGKDDPRHLWPFIADGVRAMRPELCFFENVEGHISLGLREVIGELESIGYRATWGIFSAAEVGAPHQRKRVFILAHDSGGRRRKDWVSAKLWPEVLEQSSGDSWSAGAGENGQERESMANAGHLQSGGWAEPSQQEYPDTTNGGRGMGHAIKSRLEGPHNYREASGRIQFDIGKSDSVWPSRPGAQQHGWEPPRVVGLAYPTSQRGGGKGRNTIHQKRRTGQAGAAGLSENPHWRVCAAIADNQPTGDDAAMADSDDLRLSHPADQQRHNGAGGDAVVGTRAPEGGGRQAQPALGGDADGTPGRLGYAELCVSSDNRTDELRMLGNGVVPATAELAFRTLINRLT